mgnify:CR=1 FL=1
MASVDTIKRNLVKTIDAMKKNIEKFKKAKNDIEKKKYAKIAYKLQAPADAEKDIQKLAKKFEGPLGPVIKLINTKDELHQAIQLILNKAEENKPGLAAKAKILLKKTINDL